MPDFSIRISIYDRPLFAGESLAKNLDERLEQAVRDIARLQPAEVLSLDVDHWVAEKVERVVIPTLTLRFDDAVLEKRGDRPLLVIPIDGPAELTQFDPERPARLHRGQRYQHGPRPKGFASEGEIRCELPPPSAELDPKALIDRRFDQLRPWVGKVNDLIDAHRSALSVALTERLNERVAQEKDAERFYAASPLPLRVRPDAPRVFKQEPIVRKPVPSPKPAQTKEHFVLSPALYEHIVGIVRAAGYAMTRSPATYAGWGEEDRRQALLLILNTHYEGKAYAEAFNADGKTDILVRVEDQNVFIAECLMWDGPKKFSDKADQLFGYATWHDTKLALVAFVELRDLTTAIEAGRSALSEHAQFANWLATDREAELRCQVRFRGDDQRLMTLHVFFVHTPADTPGTQRS